MTTAYAKLVSLRKTQTRAKLAAALDCSIAQVDRVLKNKEANEAMSEKILKLTDAALARVAGVRDPGGKSASASKPVKEAKKTAKKAKKAAKPAKPAKKATAETAPAPTATAA